VPAHDNAEAETSGWIATQEPNVHSGLCGRRWPFISPPTEYFFARSWANLLYWVGEDRIQFSSDYALWTPRWLVERSRTSRSPTSSASTLQQHLHKKKCFWASTPP